MAQPPAPQQPSWHLTEDDVSVAAPAARDDAEDLRLASHSPSMLRAAYTAVLEAPSLLKLLLLALVMFAAGGGAGWSSARSSELRDSTIGAVGLSSSPSPSASGAPLSSSSSASATLTPGVSASLTSSLTPPSTPAVTRPPLPLPSDGPGISRDAARYLVAGQQRVTFLGLGDWGQCSDNADPIGRSSALNCVRQRSLVASMEAWGVASGAAAVLSLGDSFYDGVSDEADARFTYSWREVYNTPFLRAAPWFVIQGNHDYVRSLDAPVGWGSRIHADAGAEPWDSRWNAPDLNFTLRYSFGSAPGACVALVLFDTSPLIDLYRSGALGGGPTRSPNSNLWNSFSENIRASRPSAQLAWLRGALRNASTSCDAILVAGHHQVYSSGTHGRAAREQDLRDRLALPAVFSWLGVDAYLGGHDHFLEALEGGGVQYFVSGAGADLRTNNFPRSPQSRFLWDASNGFTVHSINATHASHILVASNGAVLHHVLVPLARKLRSAGGGRGTPPREAEWFA